MKTIFAAFLIISSLSAARAQSRFGVKVYEGTEEIPTYQKGPDEVSPVFYTGRGVQGTAGHIYPYPAQTDLSDSLTMETYHMVYLENEYLKVTILPAFGGKLFSAIDKTNGHELFHRNSVIKPDLIGTLGAWISGGIEWCFPNHHRTTTLLPADYRIENNADGSATVWIGETERSRGLRGVVGITLRPGRSYIEADYRLNNPNDATKTFLFWANVAVTAGKDFRTFWPPSQEIGVFHNNSSFTHWPISHELYNGVDYTSGVDMTWWKNHPRPVSIFFWQGKKGFIGGYDYAKKAGEVHVGNPHINKTSKLWQFGPGLEGQNARRKLTDDGKAYVELMTGTYSNNQPDYSWFMPHSVKDAKNYWYPIRDLEVVKNANTDAAVTLQMRDGHTVFYGFNTTKFYKCAKAILKYDGNTLAEKQIDIDPGHPFTATYKDPKVLDRFKLHVELQDKSGDKLIAYEPYRPKNPELPDPQEHPKSPEQTKTVEDLYLAGKHIEQFSLPGRDPEDYYLEALKRAPDDYRVNLAMGIRRINQWRYEEAQKYLQKAEKKLRVQYMQPEEGDVFYYLALAQKGLGNHDEAYNNFFQATWYYKWFSSAYYQLALMETSNRHFDKALEFIKKAYSTNNYDGKINVLYSAILRRLGKREDALRIVNQLLDYDPLNFSAIYEKSMLEGDSSLEAWHKNMQDVDNDFLNIAVNYINAGLYDEGIGLLASLQKPENPLVCYYLGWLYAKNDQPNKAREAFSRTQKMSFKYCFPYRKETEAVLKYAIKENPGNEVTYYLLGNLLYDHRPADAIKAWNRAVAIKGNFPMVWRNLAFGAFYHQNKTDSSVVLMRRAISEDNTHPRWYAELAEYSDLSDLGAQECLSILQTNADIALKDITAPKYMVNLYNLSGEYEKAIELLKTHHFRTWEGGREIHDYYVDSYVLEALKLMKGENYDAAIESLNAALLYPENLEVGKSLNDGRNAMIYYFLGEAYEKSGKSGKSSAYYTMSTHTSNGYRSEDLSFYQAMAYQALKQSSKADEQFRKLIEKGQLILDRGLANAGVGVENISSKKNKSLSEAYYLQALGNIGLGNVAESQKLLHKSLDAYKNNLWAKYYLAQISEKPE